MPFLLTVALTFGIVLFCLCFAVWYFRWLHYKITGVCSTYRTTMYQLFVWLTLYVLFLGVGLFLFGYVNQEVGYWLLGLSWVFGYGILHYLVIRNNTASLFATAKLFTGYIIGIFVCFGTAIILVRSFLFIPFLVTGDGMSPTFVHNDYVLLQRAFLDIDRGDVMVLQSNERYFMQRVISLPGEVVEVVGGEVLISGTPLVEPYVDNGDEWEYGPVMLGAGEYFLLDDDRGKPITPRVAGAVAKEQFVGRYVFRINQGRDDR